jgi:nucleoside-triphosphatase THEP1
MTMHVFLTGPKRIGKSTAIQKTLSLLGKACPISLGGFLTYWGGEGDSSLYIADAGGQVAPTLLAERRDGSMSLFPEAFEVQGTGLLRKPQGANLILMDELGFLEKDSPYFRQTALARLDGDIPVLGVLREGHIPWHVTIKTHPRVTIYNVSLDNRDLLPQTIADVLKSYIFVL